jgi:glucan 1,3-beta-glucosidase
VAQNPPTLLASSNFAGIALIDADPYVAGGANWYTNQNNFYRSVRNFVIDLRQGPASGITALHWQVSQSTSLMNLRVEMGTGSAHQGMFMENGSGGFMGDLIFNGGKYGIWVGNQQFTVRNLTVRYFSISVCEMVGLTGRIPGEQRRHRGLLDLELGLDLPGRHHQQLSNRLRPDDRRPDPGLADRRRRDDHRRCHHEHTHRHPLLRCFRRLPQGLDRAQQRQAQQRPDRRRCRRRRLRPRGHVGQHDDRLLDSSGRIFGRTHPQYGTFAASQFVSIRSLGAKGDGVTDDTTVIQNALNTYGSCSKIIFFDHGVYYVTKTLTVPPGSRLVGEVWPVILGGGSNFQSQSSPQVVVKVGTAGQTGTAEITDIMCVTYCSRD